MSVDGWKHLILPAITLAVFQLTLIMRLVRSEMLEVLRADYIKFARARGLPNRAVYFGHALKNTLVPVITITGLQLGSLIAFAIITETVFQWPGMGLLFIQAVTFADIPVMAAYLCLIALIFVVINLVVDLLYFVVDPRLRVERRGGQAPRTIQIIPLVPLPPHLSTSVLSRTSGDIERNSLARKPGPHEKFLTSSARPRSHSPVRWRARSPCASPTRAMCSRWTRTRSTKAFS